MPIPMQNTIVQKTGKELGVGLLLPNFGGIQNQ
jgi:hypothetical protein